MRRFLLHIALILMVPAASAQLLPSLGGERSGTSGFQFLKVPVDPRGVALGEAVTASATDASGLYWNPALVAGLTGINAGFYHTAYFVDVTLDYAALTYHLPGSGFTFGASIQTLNSGEMDVTTEFQPEGTGQVFRFMDLGVGVTVAQQLTDLFSYGVTTKYIRESVAGLTAQSVVFDLGILYRIGASGASMAVSVRNFGLDGRPEGTLERTVIADDPVRVENSFEALTPPTTFHLGFAYEILRDNPSHSVTFNTQLNNPSDNAETWNAGAEYGWDDMLFLRTGYRFGIEEIRAPSLGVGIAVPLSGRSFRFDYGFNRMQRLGNVHRAGLTLSI